MGRRGQHVDEIGDLGVRACPLADRECDPALGMCLLQPPDDLDGRVVRVGDAEDDLVVRVVLRAEALEVLVEVDARALERLQDGDGRRVDAAVAPPAPRAPEEAHGRDELEPLVADTDAGEDDARPDEERHGGRSLLRPPAAVRSCRSGGASTSSRGTGGLRRAGASPPPDRSPSSSRTSRCSAG